MTAIRSLDIRRGEVWTPMRLPLHMAEAMAVGMRLRPKPRVRAWVILGWFVLIPPIAAVAMVAALWILRKGLL